MSRFGWKRDSRAWSDWWSRSGESELRQLLLAQWDILAIADMDVDPEWEYAHEADLLGQLLRDGTTGGELTTALGEWAVARGMLPDSRRDGDVAKLALAWYGDAAPNYQVSALEPLPSDAEIKPGRSIQSVTLDDSIERTRAAMGDPVAYDEDVDGDVKLRYESIDVYFRDGRAFMITAESPDAGRAPSGIRVGATWADLVRALGEVFYDEEYCLWFGKQEPGVWYEVFRPPRPGDDVDRVVEMFEVLDPKHAVVGRIYVMAVPADFDSRAWEWGDD